MSANALAAPMPISGEERWNRPALVTGGDQCGVRQGADEDDLLALTDVDPRHRHQDQRGIRQEKCATSGGEMLQEAIGCGQGQRDQSSLSR